MFCTAHLQSDADVDRLLHPTASSVAHQTRPTKLWLSVSHEPAVNRQRVLALADRLPAGGRFIVPRSSKSQFEHLRLLCDKYVEQEPASLADTTSSQHWLLFMQGGLGWSDSSRKAPRPDLHQPRRRLRALRAARAALA